MVTPAQAELLEQLAEENPEAVLFDGLEDALVGLARRQYQGPWAVYDRDRILEILQVRDEMSEEDALDWYGYNIAGLWAGDETPLILETCDDEAFDELASQGPVL